jgi:Flp pilus assembly protein TadG
MKMTNQKGAAAIEFAVILPLLLVIIFGIIEFSVYFFDKAVITNASREGARAGVVFADDRCSGSNLHSDWNY